jgi:hypothetical protein
MSLQEVKVVHIYFSSMHISHSKIGVVDLHLQLFFSPTLRPLNRMNWSPVYKAVATVSMTLSGGKMCGCEEDGSFDEKCLSYLQKSCLRSRW